MINAIFILGFFCWFLTFYFAFTKRQYRKYVIIWLQLYVMMLIYTFIRSQAFIFVLSIICPILPILFIFESTISFAAFWVIFPFALLAALITFWLVFKNKKLRFIAIIPTAIAFMIAGVIAGEIRSPQIMCDRAREIGATEILYFSFYFSLSHPGDFLDAPPSRAITQANGFIHEWRYSTMTWVQSETPEWGRKFSSRPDMKIRSCQKQ